MTIHVLNNQTTTHLRPLKRQEEATLLEELGAQVAGNRGNEAPLGQFGAGPGHGVTGIRDLFGMTFWAKNRILCIWVCLKIVYP